MYSLVGFAPLEINSYSSKKKKKHIERKYHLIREIVHRGDVAVMKIASQDNLADLFTKTLPAKLFESHLSGMGLKTCLTCFRASGRLLGIVPCKA